MVKISGAVQTPGRATETAERLERFITSAVSTIIEEGFGPVLAERREVVFRAVGFESRRPVASGKAADEVRSTVSPFSGRQGLLRLVRFDSRGPKPEGGPGRYVSVFEAVPARKVVGFMEEVDARGPHCSEALARSEADLSHKAESIETL